MSNESDIIVIDNPLNISQKDILGGLLEVIIPPSEDGRLPSAAELDLIAHIEEQEPEFIPVLVEALDGFVHPAAALHQGNLRVPLKEDFQKLKTVLEQMCQTPTTPNAISQPTLSAPQESSKETPADPPIQMNLF